MPAALYLTYIITGEHMLTGIPTRAPWFCCHHAHFVEDNSHSSHPSHQLPYISPLQNPIKLTWRAEWQDISCSTVMLNFPSLAAGKLLSRCTTYWRLIELCNCLGACIRITACILNSFFSVLITHAAFNTKGQFSTASEICRNVGSHNGSKVKNSDKVRNMPEKII